MSRISALSNTTSIIHTVQFRRPSVDLVGTFDYIRLCTVESSILRNKRLRARSYSTSVDEAARRVRKPSEWQQWCRVNPVFYNTPVLPVMSLLYSIVCISNLSAAPPDGNTRLVFVYHVLSSHASISMTSWTTGCMGDLSNTNPINRMEFRS